MTLKEPVITEQPTLNGVIDALEPLIKIRVPAITFERTTKSIALAGKPPRVVWAPAPGGTKPVDSPGRNPRTVIVRSKGLQVYCWGSDWKQTELLSDAVMSIMQTACNGSIDWQSDPWPLETEQLADQLTKGSLNVLACTIDISVMELPERPVVVNPTPVQDALTFES